MTRIEIILKSHDSTMENDGKCMGKVKHKTNLRNVTFFHLIFEFPPIFPLNFLARVLFSPFSLLFLAWPNVEEEEWVMGWFFYAFLLFNEIILFYSYFEYFINSFFFLAIHLSYFFHHAFPLTYPSLKWNFQIFPKFWWSKFFKITLLPLNFSKITFLPQKLKNCP